MLKIKKKNKIKSLIEERKKLIKIKRNKNNKEQKSNNIFLTYNQLLIFFILILILIVYIIYKHIKKEKEEPKIYKEQEQSDINNNKINHFTDINVSLNLSYDELHNIFKNEEDLKLFLENKTLYYYKKRKFFLDKSNWEYNESNIITFQNKLNYLLIHESPEYKSLLADKIRLHEYSQKILGKDICVPIIKIYNNSNEINIDELPKQFVLKCNHGSNMNIIVSDKSVFNFEKAKRSLNNWMNTNYFDVFGEVQYLFIKRKILLAPYLGGHLSEYKIFCFNGEPKYIVLSKIHNNQHIYNYFNLNWTLTDIEHGLEGYIRDPNIIEKPNNLNLMIEYAKELSNEFVFVRVDFYEINNTVYLSELTFSPSDNHMTFKNQEQSIYLGSLLDITKIRPYLFNH